MNNQINNQNLSEYCQKLALQDTDLAFIFNTYATPPLWSREAGFATLLHIILEQHVSLLSAQAAFDKLKTKVGNITPESVLALTDAEMKAAYFSRQKMSYARNLANAVLEKSLNFENLETLPDEKVREELTKIKGIGRWTADIYLLMAMLRADIMPKGDLALHIAWQKLTNLENRPKSDEFLEIAEQWKPFRSVAARLLWHFYLNRKKEIQN